MVTIFKNKKDFISGFEYIELNDVFFNQNTAAMLDERAKDIIERIDGAVWISQFKIQSKFDNVVLDIDKLSTGCKTVLNVLYHYKNIFCIKECGENALEVLYSLDHGCAYSDYAMIPFEMSPVKVVTHDGLREISDYAALKEWWENEE